MNQTGFQKETDIHPRVLVASPDNSVCAVIVTYSYEYGRLLSLIVSLLGQVNHICLIDNNSEFDIESLGVIKASYPDCTVIANKANLGLAKGFNQGIRFAAENNFNYVLLLDQDSRAAPDMVERLLAARQHPLLRDRKVAAVGPVIIDRHREGPLPFLRFRPTHISKIFPSQSSTMFVSSDFLISSGSLLDMGAVMEHGGMDETLFIDNVDLEWCFRLKKEGYAFYGVSDAILFHRLGNNVRRFPLTNNLILLHPPERQYYIMRNRLLLYRRRYVPFSWKLHDIPRLLFKLFFFLMFVPPRWENMRAMILGVKAGMSGKRE